MPGQKANSLDDWLDVLRIPVFRRHHAVGDALATAMLFLAIRARAGSAGKDLKSLTRLTRQARWLGTASSGA
jgi:DNA polymerase III epsilon subunit-like protein